MLTAGQILHFETFGFLVLSNLFSSQEADAIRRKSDEFLAEARGGKPFTGEARQSIIPFFEWSAVLTRLLEDDRIYGIAEELLGPGFFLGSTEGNLFVGDTQWHGAEPSPPLATIKVAWYLDPVGKETGCLRVIPGMHRPEFSRHVQSLNLLDGRPEANPWGLSGPDVPSFPLESSPGDVVVFTEAVFHASFGGRAGRRMHAVVFGEGPRTEAHRDYLREGSKGLQYSMYPADSLVNSRSPRLQDMVSALVDMGFETYKV